MSNFEGAFCIKNYHRFIYRTIKRYSKFGSNKKRYGEGGKPIATCKANIRKNVSDEILVAVQEN